MRYSVCREKKSWYVLIEEWNKKNPNNRRRRPSGRLSFKLLEKERHRFTEDEYNGLFISIAFGLRPEEIEKSLKNPLHHSIRRVSGEVRLNVYQPKLERFNIPPEARWKWIPIRIPQQERALELIKNGCFTLPSLEKLVGIEDHFGHPLLGNCGRKEFVPFMRKKGFHLGDIASWCGHKDVQTTRQDYDDPTYDERFVDDDDEAA